MILITKQVCTQVLLFVFMWFVANYHCIQSFLAAHCSPRGQPAPRKQRETEVNSASAHQLLTQLRVHVGLCRVCPRYEVLCSKLPVSSHRSLGVQKKARMAATLLFSQLLTTDLIPTGLGNQKLLFSV